MNNSRLNRIIKEEINKRLFIDEMVNKVVNMYFLNEEEEQSSKKKQRNNKQDEYVKKHGSKEQNSMRGQVIRAAKSDAINNAAIARQMRRDNPDMKVDSSYISKMTNNKPGYTSGHYHWDKEKADAYLQAKDELGVG